MRVLGLDIATKTGFALMDKSGIIEIGNIELSSKDPHMVRFKEFRSKIGGLVGRTKPDLVIIEDTYHRNVKTSTYLNRLSGIAIACVRKDTKIILLHTVKARSQVAKCKTKEEVFEWAVDKFNLMDLVFKKDNDMTDAILLAEWGLSQSVR